MARASGKNAALAHTVRRPVGVNRAMVAHPRSSPRAAAGHRDPRNRQRGPHGRALDIWARDGTPVPTTPGLMSPRHHCRPSPPSCLLTLKDPDPPGSVRRHHAAPRSSESFLTSPSRLVTRVDPQAHPEESSAAGARRARLSADRRPPHDGAGPAPARRRAGRHHAARIRRPLLGADRMAPPRNMRHTRSSREHARGAEPRLNTELRRAPTLRAIVLCTSADSLRRAAGKSTSVRKKRQLHRP